MKLLYFKMKLLHSMYCCDLRSYYTSNAKTIKMIRKANSGCHPKSFNQPYKVLNSLIGEGFSNDSSWAKTGPQVLHTAAGRTFLPAWPLSFLYFELYKLIKKCFYILEKTQLHAHLIRCLWNRNKV